MNKVMLMGRLTRDPEVRYSQGETPIAIARFTLAINRRGRQQDDAQPSADFISCICFGKIAEVVEQYCRQGMKIAITGHIQTGSYTNRDGQKVYTTEVVLEELEFAESKHAQAGNTAASGGTTTRPEPRTTNGDGFMNIPDGLDEELPY